MALQKSAFIVTVMLPRLQQFTHGDARNQAQNTLLAALKTLQAASLIVAHPDLSASIDAAINLRQAHLCSAMVIQT